MMYLLSEKAISMREKGLYLKLKALKDYIFRIMDMVNVTDNFIFEGEKEQI